MEQRDFLNKLLEKNKYYRNGEIEILSVYKGQREYVIVKDSLGLYNFYPKNLLSGKRPTFKSSITKREHFIKIVEKVHNNFYNYDKLYLETKSDYVEVGCPIHGYFKVRADHHESGVKCRNCNQGNPLGIFNKGNAENHKEEWLKICAWLYFLKIIANNETFFKVGVVTKKDINNRLKEFPKHYNIKVIYFEKGNLYEHTISESRIIEDFKTLQYTSKENFRGKKECFSDNPLEYYYNYK
jgi:hypothetical protein